MVPRFSEGFTKLLRLTQKQVFLFNCLPQFLVSFHKCLTHPCAWSKQRLEPLFVLL